MIYMTQTKFHYMDLIKDKKDLKNLRTWISDLKQDLKRVDLLLEYSTERTFPNLILRKNYIIRQISTFETMIKIIKDDLSTLSRA